METIFIPHSDYLAHHGIKNQKWGQRRFQNYDGSLTSEGRKRYGVGESNLSKREKKQAEKAKAKAAKERAKVNSKKKADAQKAAEQKQKRMDYLRDHPEKIYKYRKELTQDDVTDIMQKVKFDRSLQDIRKDEVDRGMRKIDRIKRNFDTANNIYSTGKNTYNNIAEINNALIDMGIMKNGKRMKKWGEKDDSAAKKLEKLIRTEAGIEEITKNLAAYSTDDINKAVNRLNAEDKLQDRISRRKDGGNNGRKEKTPKGSWANNAHLQELLDEGRYEDALNWYPEDAAAFFSWLKENQ